MVLLTSSSISVALSSGVVFLFTFLLFLSGYVVQQQSVRSLQAAIHQPPMPTPTLPPQFQKGHDSRQTGTANSTVLPDAAELQNQQVISDQTKPLGFQTIIKSDPEPSALPNSEDQIEVHPPAQSETVPEGTSAGQQITQDPIINQETTSIEDSPASLGTPLDPEQAPQSLVRLAYAQLVNTPSQICSALLFFKMQADYGDTAINRVLLYPSHWEESTSDAFTKTLSLMRLVREEYKIVYRPIKTDHHSGEREIERELVAHLATEDWEYDRMMYLRSPGLALNVAALDSALQASKPDASLSRDWAGITLGASILPSIMLISSHEIHTPRGSNRGLTAEASRSGANHHDIETDGDAARQRAAYVHFVDDELEDRRTEMEWYGGIFERYERGIAKICKGTSFDDGFTELRKVRKRGWR